MQFFDERLPIRFWRKVSPEPMSGCWLWTGYLNRPNGYGRIQIGRRYHMAHRLSLETARGPIGPGLEACHRCDTPTCVNPDHLFVGTHKENVHDAWRKGRGYKPVGGNVVVARNNLTRTHCRRGHPVEGNTRMRGKYRVCIPCAKLIEQRRKAA